MKKNKADSYEVGYGKPPKATQFKKGVSGNPKGRSKRPLDFDQALLREAKTRVTLNENGRRKRISKHDVVMKQLVNNAMKGIPSAQRMYREALEQALERAALAAGPQPTDPDFEKYKEIMNASEEECDAIINTYLERREQTERERKELDTE